MHLPLQEPPQQCKVLAELLRSRRLVRPEDYHIGQLAVEVIKLCKEAEAARLEALALDKELQLSMLLDKLQLDPLVDLDPPPLVEISQEGHNQSNNKYKGPKRRQLPWRHLQEDHWVDNRRSDHRVDNRRSDHKDNQWDPRVASHRRDRQEGHQEAHHKQQHRNKQHRRPMGQMGLRKDNHLPSSTEKDRRQINS